jgi:hypothetical protein
MRVLDPQPPYTPQQEESSTTMPATILTPGDDVHVLYISMRHGDNVTLHLSQSDARSSLAGYCREFWDEAVPGTAGPAPDDDEQVIGTYFVHVADESYSIMSAALPG